MSEELVEFEVRLGEETHRALAAIAAARGVDINDLVREAMTIALDPGRCSRSLREGRYIGKHKGKHRRAGAASWLI